MNKREVDEFLQPLKERPDLKPRPEFREELRSQLMGGRLNPAKSKRTKWIPNFAAALLMLAAVYIGSEIMFSWNLNNSTSTPGNLESPARLNSDSIADITEKEAAELIGTAFAHYSVVVNGGGPNTGSGFKHDGVEYRYMGEDFRTKEQVLSYLQEKYSERIASAIFDEIPFIVVNDKLAQPNKSITGELLWADGEILSYKKDGKKARRIEYKVHIENSEKFSVIELTLIYENGWKLDRKLPFAYGDTLEIPDEKNTETAAAFTLTEAEQAVYEKFSADYNEEHLSDLEPVSIAKLYVIAGSENNYEAEYALYTDREEYVRWTEEEHLEISLSEKTTKEEILEIYNGIQNGKFIEKNENHGYIEFNNNGLKGFQMIKDEDGIWNVGFMPIQ
ncbi:hypothetical protein FZC84_07205 [Rossellomorea vietnamensis]|uniref:Uncharacterized protein n=1 Tax=Rossellomorea vietnamensis TaxID=218284 RepID=A0A5D4MH31_9BACI|nr:DL-endopeptidase inhibitor IseA family protein [Rossellomorea vietnamensis]TYS00321.1 hypothetical protein FZC84_07205 [Rossellomorea vietnamensis]